MKRVVLMFGVMALSLAACATRDPLPACTEGWGMPSQFGLVAGDLSEGEQERYALREGSFTDGGTLEYVLTTDEAAGTLTEQFVLKGRSYVIKYRVTECNRVTY